MAVTFPVDQMVYIEVLTGPHRLRKAGKYQIVDSNEDIVKDCLTRKRILEGEEKLRERVKGLLVEKV